ncbi:hypothetical protein L9F63_022898 [Diploptera punctata]|uniref:CHK kinase-like domain-containing protein n=1 Tax=Diploptera punctata TaxID=6984 RepID=A0AAD7ZLK3_DIPPU|nr:hypothetical protein L9F63_022898 [Diploptera punctata]
MGETPPSWINSEFLEKAVKFDRKNPDIEIISFDIKRAAAAGDHYGSEMYRATVKTKENGKNEEISLIVKCNHQEGEMSKILEDCDVFRAEAKTFTDVHVLISKLLQKAFPDSYQPIAANCIYTQELPTAIVLDDLKKQGFKLASVTHGLDLKHCLLVMRKIAQYHACSVVLRHQDPSRFEAFKEYLLKNGRAGMSGFFTNVMKSMRNEVESWDDGENYLDALKTLEIKTLDRWINAVLREDDGYNVLIHGDLWMNNMMFRYSEKQDVQEVRFVDFQLSYITSPAIDLQYFINSSASPEVITNDYQLMIDEYYNTLCDTFKRLGHEELQPSRDVLNAELEKKKVFGIVGGLSIRCFALVDRNHVPDMEKVMKKDEIIHLSEKYKETLRKLMPWYYKWGWLNF